MVNGKLATAIEALPTDLLHADEFELHRRAKPSPLEWRLRQKLHELVEEARVNLRDSISITSIYDGICAKNTFFTQIIPNPVKVAFITRPIVEHTAFYNAIHQEAMGKIFRIVQETELDVKSLPVLMKLAELSANRVHGAVAQRMQIQSKNMNIDVNSRDLAGPESPDDIQARITQLQAKLLEGPKDVTPKTDEE